jgi:CheY-like chemotaxis protein
MSQQVDSIQSVLLIDDDPDALKLHLELLRRGLKATVVPSRFPTQAIRLAETHFFDIILIDVSMNFRGSLYGGLEVYKALSGRYGCSSLIAYSEKVTDELLKSFDYANFNFIEKGRNPLHFVEEVIARMNSLRSAQSCFIAMPFSSKYDRVHAGISKCIRRMNYDAIRIDQTHFTDSIVQRIFDGIIKAKFVIFLATDKNPNAFYECGYAVALKKEVITLTDSHASLPFDIRDRHAIAYGRDFSHALKQLRTKLAKLTRVDAAQLSFE